MNNLDVKENNNDTIDWDIQREKVEQLEKETLWKERTGLNEETLVGAIEALIFLSDKPLSIQKIKKSIDADLPLRLIQDQIDKIQDEFEKKNHGLRLVEVADGYQLRTKVQYSKILNNLVKAPVVSLSPLSLEVLSVITFKQPISKNEIDDLRGVDSGHLIRGLLDKSLIKIVGKSEEVGKPVTYGTTRDFLELFELNELEDLPSMLELVELAEENIVGDIEDIRELVKVDKDKFLFDELEEVDKIREQIKNIQTDTEFTKELKVNKKKPSEESKTGFEILEEFVEASDEVEIEETTEEEIALSESVESIKEENQLFSDENELERLLDNAFDDLQGDIASHDDENLHASEIESIQKRLKEVDKS